MTLIKTLYSLPLFIFFSMAIAQASTARDSLIKSELNCIDGRSQQSSAVSWDDVCDVPQPNSQDHMDIVNQELDQIQGPASQTDTAQQNPPSMMLNKNIRETNGKIYYQPSPENPRFENKVNFDLAFQTSSSNYKSGNDWPFFYSQTYPVSNQVKEKGSLYGIYLASTWRGPLHTQRDFWGKVELPNFAKLELDATDGPSSYSSYVTGKLNGYNDWNADVRFLLGYDYQVTNRIDMAPYTGFGYWRITNNDGGYVDFIANNHYEYATKTSVMYIPVGLETSTVINDQWDMDLKLETDFVIAGTVNDHLNDIPGSLTGYDNLGNPIQFTFLGNQSNLNGGYGFRGSLKLLRKFKYCNLFVEPFFKYLYLNPTNKVQLQALGNNGNTYVSVYSNGSPYTVGAPKNSIVNVGVRAGVEF